MNSGGKIKAIPGRGRGAAQTGKIAVPDPIFSRNGAVNFLQDGLDVNTLAPVSADVFA
jgi:hypothetical protein